MPEVNRQNDTRRNPKTCPMMLNAKTYKMAEQGRADRVAER